MVLSKKPVRLLYSLALFAIMAFTVHAAPTGQGQGQRPQSDTYYFDGKEYLAIAVAVRCMKDFGLQ